MKRRKIIILFLVLFLILIINMPKMYAASEPSAKDNPKNIIEWIRDNSSKVEDVSISKLLSWYKICETDTVVMSKLQTALCKKSSSEIEKYCKGKNSEQIKNAVNDQKILSSWSETVPVTQKDLKNKLTQATSTKKNESEEQKEDAQLQSKVISPSAFDPSKSRESINDDVATKLGNKIIGGIQALGSIISVLVLVIIGIKYMMGSVEEKAEYKSTMIPYLIGAFLVFASSNIVSAIYNAIY